MVKIEGVDPRLDALIKLAYDAAGFGPDDVWERPLPDLLSNETGDRRALIQIERSHDDCWTVRWKADDWAKERVRGNTTGVEVPAYSTHGAGERLSGLLDALDYWLLTGDGGRLADWE